MAVDWKNYEGKYASCKVDFNEVCEAYNSLGKDLQNKSVFRGDKYTAVFIGPGGMNYLSMIDLSNKSDIPGSFRNELMKYLTDSYAMLAGGLLSHKSLKQTADAVNLYMDGVSNTALIDSETYRKYASAIKAIIDASSEFYTDSFHMIYDCLRNTRVGRLGVPPENMMMNFWRYSRKVLAKELYEARFLTDRVPELGVLTVFYDNAVDELGEMFA